MKLSLYEFRDLDLMHRLAENNGEGIKTRDLGSLLGLEAEEPLQGVGVRLAWMRRYGMVAFDEQERTWSLSDSGRRIVQAQLRAPALRTIEQVPDEAAVELMAHITSRFQRGEPMLAHMLRREFLYGTKRR